MRIGPQHGITRRGLLQAGLAGACAARAAAPRSPKWSSRAIRPSAPPEARPIPRRVLKLLDRAMQSFYGGDSPLDAWKKVARPGEVVGLKVNCLSGKGAATNPVLVEAICERLQQAGIPQKDIVIWDRLNSDLESAGYRVASRKDRIRCIGNDAAGYDTDLAVYGSVGSLLSNTLTRTCDAVINLPVLKDHGIVGRDAGAQEPVRRHSQSRTSTTPNAGDPYVADVNMLPPIRRKVRLTICDGLTAQYEGGPSYMPQWSWPYNGLMVARDPVALDYTGWQILERKRAEKGMKPLRELHREPLYIATAADAAPPAGDERSEADRRGGGVTPWIAESFFRRWRFRALRRARRSPMPGSPSRRDSTRSCPTRRSSASCAPASA